MGRSMPTSVVSGTPIVTRRGGTTVGLAASSERAPAAKEKVSAVRDADETAWTEGYAAEAKGL